MAQVVEAPAGVEANSRPADVDAHKSPSRWHRLRKWFVPGLLIFLVLFGTGAVWAKFTFDRIERNA